MNAIAVICIIKDVKGNVNGGCFDTAGNPALLRLRRKAGRVFSAGSADLLAHADDGFQA